DMASDDRDGVDDPVDNGPVGGAGTDERAPHLSLAERVPPGLVFRWAAAATLGVLMVFLIGYGLYAVRSILILVVIALFIAVSLDPAVRWLIKKGVRRSLAVTIVILFVLALFGVFIWSIVPPLVEQGDKLFSDLPGYLKTLSKE